MNATEPTLKNQRRKISPIFDQNNRTLLFFTVYSDTTKIWRKISNNRTHLQDADVLFNLFIWNDYFFKEDCHTSWSPCDIRARSKHETERT